MKVAHLLPALDQGGVESVVCSLNRALVRIGDECVVISRGGRLVERIVADGGRHIELDLKSKNLLTCPVRALRLRRALREERPDLVCVHSRVPAWLFVLANRTLGLKWITYAHGANSVSAYSAVMTRGDRVIVPTKFLAEYLSANYRFDRSKLRVIPPGVDLERFDPEKIDRAVADRLRRELGIAEGDRVVMSVGRITPLKGFDGLIRSFAEECGKDPRAKLVIVGSADRHHLDYFESLKALVGTLGLRPGSVVFAGAQEKMPECLSLATEVVSANVTKPESFGLSVAEALAMNRPVRLFRRFGGAAEIVDSVSALSAATPRDAIRALYGYDIMTEKTREAYSELAAVREPLARRRDVVSSKKGKLK